MLKEIYYKVGQEVEIENTTLSGIPFSEGKARLKCFISKEQTFPYAEWWKVEFPADKGVLFPRKIAVVNPDR